MNNVIVIVFVLIIIVSLLVLLLASMKIDIFEKFLLDFFIFIYFFILFILYLLYVHISDEVIISVFLSSGVYIFPLTLFLFLSLSVT